ncbi:MAG: SurA N-terminal domain-containing protein, partial [Anaerolineae bacterium]
MASKKSRRSSRKGGSDQPARQTKKQIAIGRKQARQNRIIYISVAALAVVVIAILAIGIISELVIKPNQPVATVNGTKIPLDDYQDMLTYRRYNLHTTINQIQSTLDSLNPEDEQSDLLRSIYEQQLQQTQTSLALASEDVLDELIEDELIREEANQLGLTVTDAEVEQAIFGDLEQALSQPTQTVVTGTEEIPTATPIPQEQLEEVYNSILSNIGIDDSSFRSLIARGLLREKLQNHLADQVETTGLVAQVSLIATDTEEKALEAQARIEGGEDFAIVAQEVSSDTVSL